MFLKPRFKNGDPMSAPTAGTRQVLAAAGSVGTYTWGLGRARV